MNCIAKSKASKCVETWCRNDMPKQPKVTYYPIKTTCYLIDDLIDAWPPRWRQRRHHLVKCRTDPPRVFVLLSYFTITWHLPFGRRVIDACYTEMNYNLILLHQSLESQHARIESLIEFSPLERGQANIWKLSMVELRHMRCQHRIASIPSSSTTKKKSPLHEDRSSYSGRGSPRNIVMDWDNVTSGN